MTCLSRGFAPLVVPDEALRRASIDAADRLGLIPKRH